MKYVLKKEYPGSPKLGTESIDDHSRYPEFWEVIRQPLIKAVDGTPIYVGDTYFVVFDVPAADSPNLFVVNGPFKAVFEKNSEFSTAAKYFIKREDAIVYVSEYKPVLSVRDLVSISVSSLQEKQLLINLLNIAKSKI